jgi:cystathionine beta-lyase/cystathionine gamma-synthase
MFVYTVFLFSLVFLINFTETHFSKVISLSISKFFKMQISKDSVINCHKILKDLIFCEFLKNPLTNFKDLLEFHKLLDP